MVDYTSIAGPDGPTHCTLQLTEKRQQWLQELDDNPQPLIDFLNQLKLRRLGFYHETLWHFFLQQDDEVELITTNCQVQQAGRTIGEFDVIYRNRLSGQVVHLELAFKVYLLAPGQPATDLSSWLGPNLNDRLDLKLQHMLNHQCRLSLTEAGQDSLRDMNIDLVTREISLRGYLFYGETEGQVSDTNSILNPGHRTGQWLPLSETIKLLGQHEAWTSLNNLQWIGPMDSKPSENFKPAEFADYLQDHFEQRQSPLMISASDPAQMGSSMESYRLMVTPNDWPERHLAPDTR